MNVKRILEDFYCKEGDIVFADASEDLNDVGKSIEIVNLNNEKLLSGLHTLLARPKENYFSIGFNGFLFKSNNIRLQIQKEAQGSKVLSINVGRISSIEIAFPSLKEQQKIATFFTAIDKKLSGLKQKRNLLEQYKKGVMQQLFSQALRFKNTEGSSFEDWEVKSLGEVGEVKMCKRIFNEETLPIGEIPFYKIGSFGKEADAYIPEKLYLEYRKKYSFPKKGDILISAAGTIGRTVVYNGEDAYYQDSNIVWIDNNCSVVSNGFLFYIYQIVKFDTEGGTIQRLYNNILKSTKFSCPCLAEQTQIAHYLSAIDAKIQGVTGQIAKMEAWKKGLLQQMFV
jgi:type I restriction enzyme, S subunit